MNDLVSKMRTTVLQRLKRFLDILEGVTHFDHHLKNQKCDNSFPVLLSKSISRMSMECLMVENNMICHKVFKMLLGRLLLNDLRLD